ncbi:hypothetical protein EMELA_v1c00130 [Mesoplasma melaleucae]|uniref:Uncharacterized protein n=1 Tax=Mesoplasma melaleucae TaxID=81459 RepID=A0A2K8NWN2_9MOLU|nr:hypothetical protein EMELA_v1c00130 [Mesoplasma melaleucae]
MHKYVTKETIFYVKIDIQEYFENTQSLKLLKYISEKTENSKDINKIIYKFCTLPYALIRDY